MFELVEQVVEPIETRVPGALEGAHPIVNGFERGPVDPVPAMSSFSANEDEADSSQDAEVLGDLRLSKTQSVDEISYGRFAGPKCGEKLSATCVRDGIEGIGRGEVWSHESTYSDIGICQRL